MDPSLDAVLAYRNLLCAEDHLDELRMGVEDGEERDIMDEMMRMIVSVRDNIMPEEKVSKWHCVVKHLAVAYEASREIAKATGDPVDQARADILRSVLNRALSALWAREIKHCERCRKNDGGSTPITIGDGLSGGTVQTISTDREFRMVSD